MSMAPDEEEVPFIFQANTPEGLLSVLEVAGHINIAFGAQGVAIPLEAWKILVHAYIEDGCDPENLLSD